MESLVSTEWLANEMGASDLRIVDCTKHLPGTGRDPKAEYEAGHIPGAVFMDLGDLTDTSNLVRIVQETQQDEIYNLGAQSHVAVSFESPEYTADVDAMGSVRLLEAIRLLGMAKK